MSSITDMALPDAVVSAGLNALGPGFYLPPRLMTAAIRAALQAMCDCGMAKLTTQQDFLGHFYPVVIIRLNADERKEQT